MKTTFTFLRQVLPCVLLFFTLSVSASEDDFAGIHCPGDKWVDCDAELWDLSIYGNAYYVDYGGQHDAGEPEEKWHLNSCNQGYITRTWKVKIYSQWHSCTQTIHVGGGNYGEPNIHWPDDLQIEGCNPDLDPDNLPGGKPSWDNQDCSMLGVTHKDQWFYFGSNTCKKLLREWTVMDWCTYDADYNPNEGLYKHTQVIKVSLEDVPELDDLDDITVSTSNCNNAYVHADPLVINPSVCGGEFDVFNDSPYADDSGADISGTYPVGTTYVKYTVRYGCGQKKYATVKVIVDNNKAPTPYCHAYLAVALMGIDNDDDGVNDEGMVEVWAKDLDAGSYGHCGYTSLDYSFSEDKHDDVRVFNCDDVGTQDIRMYVFNKSGNFNFCTVELSVQNNAARITDCDPPDEEIDEEEEEEEEEIDDDEEKEEIVDVIDSTLQVKGTVIDVFGNLISDVEIGLTSPDDSLMVETTIDTLVELIVDSTMVDGEWQIEISIDTNIIETNDTLSIATDLLVSSDDHGAFSFHNIFIPGRSYEVQGYGFSEIPYEISVADLQVLFDHLRKVDIIEDPLLLLAADVDLNGTVDVYDMRIMVDVITGRADQFPVGVGSYILRLDEALDNPHSAVDNPDMSKYDVLDIDVSFLNADFVVVYVGKLISPADNLDRQSIVTRELVGSSDLTDQDLMDMLHQFFQIGESGIHIYPNPTRGQVQLNIQADKDQLTTIQFFSMEGRAIWTEQLVIPEGNSKRIINTANLTSGVYFYNVSVDDQIFTGKIIKTE